MKPILTTIALVITLQLLIAFWIYAHPINVRERYAQIELEEAKAECEAIMAAHRYSLIDTKFGLILFKSKTYDWIDE